MRVSAPEATPSITGSPPLVHTVAPFSNPHTASFSVEAGELTRPISMRGLPVECAVCGALFTPQLLYDRVEQNWRRAGGARRQTWRASARPREGRGHRMHQLGIRFPMRLAPVQEATVSGAKGAAPDPTAISFAGAAERDQDRLRDRAARILGAAPLMQPGSRELRSPLTATARPRRQLRPAARKALALRYGGHQHRIPCWHDG